jgi:DNA-binding XRE family transcriptional regulator
VITREQCKAARALVHMTQTDLATAARVSKQTLVDFERGARQPYDRTLADVVAALEAAGVIFIAADDIAGAGVRQRK